MTYARSVKEWLQLERPLFAPRRETLCISTKVRSIIKVLAFSDYLTLGSSKQVLLPVHSTIILCHDRNKNILYLCFWFCLCKVERDCSKERVVFIKSYLLGLSPVGLEDKTRNTCKVQSGVVVTTKSGPKWPFVEPISVCIYFFL